MNALTKVAIVFAAGAATMAEEEPETQVVVEADPAAERRVVPQSVIARQLSNPFLAPDFSVQRKQLTHRLATWELLGPLFRSFEYAAAGATSCMPLPKKSGHWSSICAWMWMARA